MELKIIRQKKNMGVVLIESNALETPRPSSATHVFAVNNQSQTAKVLRSAPTKLKKTALQLMIKLKLIKKSKSLKRKRINDGKHIVEVRTQVPVT